MKNFITLFIMLVSIGFNLLAMDTSRHKFAGVQKVNDDLYVGKVEDGFYIAMERVNQDNIDMWLRYACIQDNDRIPFKYRPSIDGARYFAMVLSMYKKHKKWDHNELWIAYASNEPVTKKAALQVRTQYCFKNYSIEMFVSVITSPAALITSHMGISRTIESAMDLAQEEPKFKKHPNQSVYLHSFAAKVMKMLYPEKVYMLSTPNLPMRSILLRSMPKDSVWVGDDFFKECIETECLPDESEIKNETPRAREARLRFAAKCKHEIEEYRLLLKTNPPRVIRNERGFTILNPDETPLVTFDCTTEIYTWLFTEPYERPLNFRCTYILVNLDALASATSLVW